VQVVWVEAVWLVVAWLVAGGGGQAALEVAVGRLDGTIRAEAEAAMGGVTDRGVFLLCLYICLASFVCVYAYVFARVLVFEISQL